MNYKELDERWARFTQSQRDYLHRWLWRDQPLHLADQLPLPPDSEIYAFNTHVNREFKSAFELALVEYPLVSVFVRPHPKLVIPSFAARTNDDEVVRLDYGLNLPVPIDDIIIDQEGISATLSFNRVPYPTFVPWEAIVTMGAAPREPALRPKPKLGLVP
jgi:hypothetical protein